MDAKEFDTLLNEAEVRLERLRALYEQWFQGLERLEPTIPAKDLERRMQLLRKIQPQIRNTALRFRFQTVWQRYTTFQTYWRRVARQMEEGTYRRDVMRARARRDQARTRGASSRVPAVESNASEVEGDIDVEAPQPEEAMRSDRSAALADPQGRSVRPPSSAPVPTVSKRPPAFVSPFARTPGSIPPRPKPSSAESGPGEERMRALYDQYVDARRRNNERTDTVRYETLAKSIREMVPKLRAKHKDEKIDFEVVIRNGRVGLKPVTKK